MGASNSGNGKGAASSESAGFNWKKILGWLVVGYLVASCFAGAPGTTLKTIIEKRAASFTVGGVEYRNLQKEIAGYWGDLLTQTGAHFAEKLFWLAIILMVYVHFGKIKEVLTWAYGMVSFKRPDTKTALKDDHDSSDAVHHEDEPHHGP